MIEFYTKLLFPDIWHVGMILGLFGIVYFGIILIVEFIYEKYLKG